MLGDDKVRALLRGPLPRLTAKTITRAPELLREIAECRRTGIAVDDEEHTEGICALGTGFIDPMGRAIALSIPVPTTRFRRIRADLATRLLEARARMLAALN